MNLNKLEKSVDKAIRALAPEWGLKRARARATMAVADRYVGASMTRRQTAGWRGVDSDADGAVLLELPEARRRSRDLVRNAPIAGGIVGNSTRAIVGTGLALSSRPDAELLGITPDQAVELGKQIERYFKLYAESTECDITKRMNFYGLQGLACFSAFEAGDTFAVLPMLQEPNAIYSTRVQLVEADRVVTPTRIGDVRVQDGVPMASGNTISGGVEIDGNGAPVAYHIRDFHPLSQQGMKNQASKRYAAFGSRTGRRNVIHLVDIHRIGQTRSMPMLTPVIESLKQLDQFREAELMAAVVSACFTVFVTSPDGQGFANGMPQTLGGGVATAGGSDDNALAGQYKDAEQVQMAPGAVVEMPTGRKVDFANPNRPNNNFEGFVAAIAQQVGTCLGIPYEVLLMRFQASYSAARAALLQAWQFYLNRRAWLAQGFCQPIFEAWLDEAVAMGHISAPGYFSDPAMRRAYQKAEWIGDPMGSIDEDKDIDAALKRVGKVSTYEEETMKLTGTSWSEKFPQMVKEHKMLQEAGMLPAVAAPGAAPAPDGNQNPGSGKGTDQESGDGEIPDPRQKPTQ